jgi:hypothetical protein
LEAISATIVTFIITRTYSQDLFFNTHQKNWIG